MASNKPNLSSLYPQRKKKAGPPPNGKGKGSPKDNVLSTVKEAYMSTASLGFSKAQPPILFSPSSMDIEGECAAEEEALRQFDMNMRYGPCLGMSRLERWERARMLGMNPPVEVKRILDQKKGATSCLWEGRI
ncbi:hypothetical protein KP509_11G034200 [Ceratopteris richardii]|uniref:DNA polymerase delta subunit 4 n=1 Tax=Ceratopteris richardii TaxID=49495 RepID=A0A8T2TTD0_CERRI|nr:hypothetical protein KP509_11G034200 [Ceratopteris richardii]